MTHMEIIELALREDLGKLKDITSRAILSKKSKSKAKIVSKEPGIIAGINIVKEVFHILDPNLFLNPLVADGNKVTNRTELFVIEGNAISILEGERVALNFLGHLSGIATTVHKYVESIRGTNVQILDTRKTLPGLRELEKYAVIQGGGVNHRMGLFDRVLIKDNHIDAVGGITQAVNRIRKTYSDDYFIEIEARTIKEVDESINNRVNQILLDNMTCDELREAVILVNGSIPLEASGNVTLETVRAIAETGVQFISVGALTLSSKALDVSLCII